MSSKKIVHVITNFGGKGGAELMLSRLVKSLSNHDESHFVVSLLGIDQSLVPHDRNIKVYDVRIKSFLGPFRLLISLFLVARYSPTVVMGWMYYGCLASVLYSVCCFKKNVWNIRHSLDCLKVESRSTLVSIYLCRLFSFFPNAILYNSNNALSQHERFGYHPNKSIYMPNGFFIDAFPVRSPEESGSLRLLCVGRNHPSKGFDFFLKMLSGRAFQINNQEFDITIIGRNAPRLEYQFPELVTKNKLSLLDEVPGIAGFYKDFDVLILPSFNEGFPNVVCEAIFSGLIPIVCDVGDAALIVGDQRLVYQRESYESFYEALSYAHEARRSAGYLKKMRDACIERYAMEHISERYRSVLY